jgi:glycosyltransferase involved in cell wall biosynthesis
VRAAARLEASLDKRALSAVIAVSDAVRDDWRPYLASRGIPDERIEVIYSGIPVDAYRESSDGRAGRGIRDELGIPHDAPVVVTVSRLYPGKRNELLIPVLAALRERVPGTRLVVVGEGPERERLAKEIGAAGLEGAVHLVGRRLDVPAFLEAADLFVFPSGREGFGLVVVEALAAGLPVVCAPLPSLRRVAEASPALRMVADDSAAGFTAEMTALLLDPERSARLGEEGRRYIADHWNVNVSARRYEDVYLSLLGAVRAEAIGSPASTR